MPRQARKKSESGIYHVMLRGINKQQIFIDRDDNVKFLQVLTDFKEISGYKILAYCLMGNHIHLLIKIGMEPIEQVFKRICGRYVYWYNVKYQRVGHLFQDRFRSEPVEDESYLFTVIRYIHQNPVKAGLCESIEDYEFSSFNEYTLKPFLVDSDFVFQMISREEFERYNKAGNTDKCLEIEEEKKVRVTDEQAIMIIERYTGCKEASDFQRLDLKTKDEYIVRLSSHGLSIRQISRLTGTNKNWVEKCLKF